MSPTDPATVYLGTDDGLRRCALDPDRPSLAVEAATLSGESVRALSVDPRDPDRALVGCGLRGEGLHLTADGGASADPVAFEDRWVFGIARDLRDPDRVYVGTEPPMLHHSEDGGRTFESLPAVADVPGADDWEFGYEPFEAGHLHGIALHPDRPDRIVAAVEVGGVVVSRDGGETWTDQLRGFDVHETLAVPARPDRLLAAAHEGVYRSDDAGRTWSPVPGLEGRYARAVRAGVDRLYALTAPSADGDRVALYAAGPDGEDWTRRSGDLPPAGLAGALATHHADGATLLHAGDHPDGEGSVLAVSTDAGRTWARVPVDGREGDGIPRVRAIATAPSG